MTFLINEGAALDVLRSMPSESVDCCVTSPPYWGLRDYHVMGQMGNEPTPEAFVSGMVTVFAEVRRVLRVDGTCWVNLGDSYNSGSSGGLGGSTIGGGQRNQAASNRSGREIVSTLKPKDLVGIPWRVAFALQADGWYLRSDIIWHKPNPMPESVTDRPTKAHEYLFLLTKSSRYFYDSDAIKEPSLTNDTRRPYGSEGGWLLDGRPDEQRHGGEHRGPKSFKGSTFTSGKTAATKPTVGQGERADNEKRNKRDVWTVATYPYSEAHFATFPPKLVEPCILAGCPEGGTVLDPFTGSGTTGMVALRHGRNFIGIDLNPEYAAMARRRITNDAPLLNTEAVA